MMFNLAKQVEELQQQHNNYAVDNVVLKAAQESQYQVILKLEEKIIELREQVAKEKSCNDQQYSYIQHLKQKLRDNQIFREYMKEYYQNMYNVMLANIQAFKGAPIPGVPSSKNLESKGVSNPSPIPTSPFTSDRNPSPPPAESVPSSLHFEPLKLEYGCKVNGCKEVGSFVYMDSVRFCKTHYHAITNVREWERE